MQIPLILVSDHVVAMGAESGDAPLVPLARDALVPGVHMAGGPGQVHHEEYQVHDTVLE